jgi:prephenate dehydratase
MSSAGAPTTAAGRRRVAYLGPSGTFTEEVLLAQPDLRGDTHVALSTISDVLFAVHEGAADLGVVPLENAIEGTVNLAVDTMALSVDLLIRREMQLPVSLHLLGPAGLELADIEAVATIPVAWAQCHAWLRTHLPNARMVPASATSDAARAVAGGDSPAQAAIANRRSAEVYGLEVLADNIEDHPDNRTRFALVARSGIPAPTGNDKTSIVVFQHADSPGSLLEILQEFAARRINLSMLSSRPTKERLGDYCFVIDLDGHIADEVVADCLRTLRAKQADVKFLGSYPAGAPQTHQRPSLPRIDDAAIWMDSLRAEIGTA